MGNGRMKPTTSLANDLVQYLKSESEMSRKMRFVFRNGKLFTEFSPLKVPRGPAKECFANATRLAENLNLRYCEGYVAMSDIPIPIFHAWVIKGNKVVESTLIKRENVEYAYYGVVFSLKYLCETILKRGMFGLIDNMEMGFPLLRGVHTKW